MSDIADWKKTGVMGGTFNPIHTGHLLLAQWAMEEAALDGVAFIPTGNSYQKDRREILPGAERIAMTKLAIADRDCFCCLDMEVRRGGDTYTCDTLETLRGGYPGTELYFIVGADCLFSIENWYRPDRIFACCTLLAASRSGMPMERLEQKRRELAERYGARIRLTAFPNIEISSTEIRRRRREGRSIRYLTPDPVRDYIENKGFYQEDTGIEIKRTEQTEKRDIQGPGQQTL